jgi:DNA-binding SARP family transcriptional activator
MPCGCMEGKAARSFREEVAAVQPARQLTAPAAEPPAAPPVQICVLGRVRILARGREMEGGLRKARELLAFLAMHRGGARGEVIGEALWPEARPGYATARRNLAVRRARALLRAAVGLPAPMFITLTAGRYQLDPALIGADVWEFHAALAEASAATELVRQVAALRRAAGLYRGPLAEDAGYGWAEPYAEPLRRQAMDTLSWIAALLTDRDPEQALAAWEAALVHDGYNEAVYWQIMQLQARLGRPDAAARTLRLLEMRLPSSARSPARRPGRRRRR